MIVNGGQVEDGEPGTECERYIVKKDCWIRLTNLNVPRCNAGLCFFKAGRCLYSCGRTNVSKFMSLGGNYYTTGQRK
jgi:hypothetical protein